MSQKTPEGLPKISKDQLESFLYEQQDHPLPLRAKYYNELLTHLEDINPRAYDYIAKAVSEFPIRYQELAAVHLLGVYDLLKRQAEANNLEKKLEE